MSTRTKAEPTSTARRRRSKFAATRGLPDRLGRQPFVFPTDRTEVIQRQGVVDTKALLERHSLVFKRVFELEVEAAADEALRRYAKTAAVDEAWRMSLNLSVKHLTCAACR